MKKHFIYLLFFLASIFATGCSLPHVVDPTDDTRSLAFGIIKMDGLPLKRVTIKQMQPKTDKPYWRAAAIKKSGIFWHSQLPPGKYQIVDFGSNQVMNYGTFVANTKYTFNLEENKESDTAFRLKIGT